MVTLCLLRCAGGDLRKKRRCVICGRKYGSCESGRQQGWRRIVISNRRPMLALIVNCRKCGCDSSQVLQQPAPNWHWHAPQGLVHRATVSCANCECMSSCRSSWLNSSRAWRKARGARTTRYAFRRLDGCPLVANYAHPWPVFCIAEATASLHP